LELIESVNCISVDWFWRLVAGCGIISRSVPVGFLMDKMALGQVSLRVLWLYSVSVIPSMLHIHWRIYRRHFVMLSMDSGFI